MNIARRFMMPLLVGLFADFMSPQGRDDKPKRPCLQCGHLHKHNNSFCSTHCCHAYRAIKQGGK